MFNALKYTEVLEKAGFHREQAETTMNVMIEIMHENLATKQDMKDFQVAMKQDMKDLKLSMRQDINELRKTDAQILKMIEKNHVELKKLFSLSLGLSIVSLLVSILIVLKLF